MGPSMIFAWIITVLVAAACIGALAFLIVWEFCAIRRTLADHRDRDASRPPTDADFWRQQRALNELERRP